jgi:hypothetical protein
MSTTLRLEVQRTRDELNARYGHNLPSRVVVVECGQTLGLPELSGDEAYFWLEEYEPRFERHLARGHGWLNLNLDGIYANAISVWSMELPSISTQADTKVRIPDAKPSFNGWRWPEQLREVQSLPNRFISNL